MSNIYFSEKNYSDFCRNLEFKMDSSGKHQLPLSQVLEQQPGPVPGFVVIQGLQEGVTDQHTGLTDRVTV